MRLALRRPALILAPVAVAVVALAMLTNVLPFREIFAQRQEIIAAQERLESLQEANQALEAQVEALHTPLEIERLAREQLGYVRPGEEAYVVIEPEDSDPAPVTDSPAPTDAVADDGDRSWWQQLWDYVTGRDLADDG